MPQTTNLYDSYDSKGNREDLYDIIFNISPTETPLFQMAGRSRATNPMHEWQTDSLASASTSNALIEGDEYTLSEPTPTTRVNNRTQSILAKAFRGELTAQWRAENPDLISGENSAAALLEKIKAERAASGGKKASRKKS